MASTARGWKYGGLHREEWELRSREFVKRGNELKHAKLTPDKVREIRQNRKGLTLKQTAEVYGVHWRTIEKVRSYETWTHVK